MAENRVSVNRHYCKLWLCQICVGICPAENLAIRDGRIVDLGRCTACMRCEQYCPDLAITVEKGEDGTQEEAAAPGE